MAGSIQAALIAIVSVVAARVSPAQCAADWSAGFGFTRIDQEVLTSAVFDDGSGAQLYFTSAPDVNGTSYVRRWDGTNVTFVGTLTNSTIGGGARGNALCAFDDGSGLALYVGGAFVGVNGVAVDGVARWNPTSGWSAAGHELHAVEALAVYDDGSGARLYASGRDAILSRWNGTAWITLEPATLSSFGKEMIVHDDGSGPALYVGGAFSIAAAGANNVARRTGAGWSALGLGTNGEVETFALLDDGSGVALHAGGSFTQAGSVPADRIARWDGASWSALSTGLDASAHALAAFDDGTGVALYAGGSFVQAGGATALFAARWNGTSWSALGSGVNNVVQTFSVFDDGGGAALFVGGAFDTADGRAIPHLSKWTSSGWNPIDPSRGLDAAGFTLYAHDDGSGPRLFCGGLFKQAGDVATRGVGRFDGAQWSVVGGGLTYPTNPSAAAAYAFASFDDGSGPALFAGGVFSVSGGTQDGIAKWNGTSWSLVGGGTHGTGKVRALCVHDDGSGPALYAGGDFTAIGSIATRYVARWNGSTWSAVGGGSALGGFGASVYALATWDDGSGPALYAGGIFPQMGGVAGTANLARFGSGAWSAIGNVSGFVYALKPWNDGGGEKLYVGGQSLVINAVSIPAIATFDGASFTAVGNGFPESSRFVWTLTTFDEGAGVGERLYAGGSLGIAASVDFQGTARWDGASWTPLGLGAQGWCQGLAAFGGALYACGSFQSAGGVRASNISRFASSCPDPMAFCFGTSSACPCGNGGANENGCASSINANGAHIGASGVPAISSDTLTLVGTGTSNSTVLYFQGTQRVNGGAGNAFGDGLRCAGGTVIRLAMVLATNGASQYPNPGDLSVSQRGLVITPGSKRSYQIWYRNAAAFCTPATFNFSNGVEVTWGQ